MGQTGGHDKANSRFTQFCDIFLYNVPWFQEKKNIVFWKAPKFLPAVPLVRQMCNKVCGNGVMMMTGKTPVPIPHWSPQISRGIELRPSRLEAGDGPPEPLHGLLKADNNLY